MKRRVSLLCLLLVGTVFICVIVVWGIRRKPAVLFERYVLKPIPRSVAEIRVDQPLSLGGYEYVFRFRICRADLSLILDSRPLERIAKMSITPDGRCLGWDWNPEGQYSPGGLTFDAYSNSPRAAVPPSWYSDLGHWVNFEAYALEYMKNRPGMTATSILEILIYNETLGEAYFFTQSTNQRW
jgi:hypothetical protein